MHTALLTFLAWGILLLASDAQTTHPCPTYRYNLDLNQVEDDQLQVGLMVDSLNDPEVIFRMPAMVPGVYAALDFGKNITSFRAFDKRGNPLPFTRPDSNSWRIQNRVGSVYLIYTVKDDWDDFASYSGLSYRSPGSMFSANQVFLINNNSLFGYFEGYDQCPVEVAVTKPEQMYAATSLTKTLETGFHVDFKAADYHELVDNPILFAMPDTARIQLGDVPVLVACYVTSGEKIARHIASYIEPLLQNQKAYLGGRLPVKRYTFIIYLHTTNDRHNSFSDGLEHAQSTVILNNMIYSEQAVSHSVYGVASHEFFHTLMPLSLHSEEVEFYDFKKPKMSRHLWLYEGMTEYFTMHMPVKQHQEKPKDFYKEIGLKIKTMMKYDSTLSLTELGRQAVERQDQYMNVYNRGALVCLCLDIRLRAFSNGGYGVQDLIHGLLQHYGKHKPFKDEVLFEQIVRESRDEGLRDFFRKYVDGPFLPPLQEDLNKVGLILGADLNVHVNPKATKQQLALREQWMGVQP